MNLYLAGPMTGYPQFNFPLFHKAAADLRAKGFDIVSPAELDSKEIQAEAIKSATGQLVDGKIGGETWGDILSRDVKVVADHVDGIVFLSGWQASKGARLEAFVALLAKKSYFFYYGDDGIARTVTSELVWSAVQAGMQS